MTVLSIIILGVNVPKSFLHAFQRSSQVKAVISSTSRQTQMGEHAQRQRQVSLPFEYKGPPGSDLLFLLLHTYFLTFHSRLSPSWGFYLT